MKRIIEEDPGFDDVIFEDRNKEYGAYNIRKRYGSTMSISIVAGMIFGASLVVVPFFTADRGDVTPGSIIKIPYEPLDDLKEPPAEQPPAQTTPPERIINQARYMAPDIVKGMVDPAEGLGLAEETIDKPVEVDPGTLTVVPFDDNPEIPVEQTPVIQAQEMPEFPGGETALLKFINDNINYPQDALNNNIEGKVVLQFVVSATGEITKVVLLRKANPLLDEEAIRVVLSMPRWKPGKNNGYPVPVYFSVPVVFDIR